MIKRRGNDEIRREKVNILKTIGDNIEKQRDEWITYLLNIEPMSTAIDEVEKTIRALKSYDEELNIIRGREAIGTYYVALPYNNPMYSFVLYTSGIALVGNDVIVRPSKMTFDYVLSFYNKFANQFGKLGITLYRGSGKKFIEQACNSRDDGGLLFTGAYENLRKIQQEFPTQKHLIYCGQGINPLIVGRDISNIEETVKLVIDSRIYNSGQDCLCAEKIIVHEKTFEIFQTELIRQLDNLTIGFAGCENADLFPPIDGMKEFTEERYRMVEASGRKIYERKELGVRLAAFEVSLESSALNSEKFCPIFTVAQYKNDYDLMLLAQSDYKFGAVILGNEDLDIWKEYPHISTEKTIMQMEAANAHVPFGGRGKSGFSKRGKNYRDGPILFSYETSI